MSLTKKKKKSDIYTYKNTLGKCPNVKVVTTLGAFFCFSIAHSLVYGLTFDSQTQVLQMEYTKKNNTHVKYLIVLDTERSQRMYEKNTRMAAKIVAGNKE